jgi:arabinogalactan oligomer / maltooligosaccharide transport system substrate-binding protein
MGAWSHRACTAVVALLCVLALGGCASAPRRELVVWCGFKETERAVLEQQAAGFAQRSGIPVRIVRVPFEELQPKLQVSVPVGEGPDLVTGPHDWIGRFVLAGLIRPVRFSSAELARFLPVSLEVTRVGDELYGLPLSVSTLALVTNRRLLPRPPTTVAELIDVAAKLTHDGQHGFLFDDTDFFFAWPFFGGYGVSLFERGPQGDDPSRLALGTPGAHQAVHLLWDLHQKYHLLPPGTSKNSANGCFLDGTCAMTITGPWSLQEYRAKHLDYVLSPLPRLDNGHWLSPLVGVDAVLLCASSKHPDLAQELMRTLTGCEAQVQLNLAAGRIPARRDAQRDPRVATNPDVAVLGACVEHGTPMPTLPALGQVWGPMGDSLRLLTTGAMDPDKALDEAVVRVRKNIQVMMK